MKILEGMYTLSEENLDYFFRFEGDKALMVDDMRKHYLSMTHEVKETARKNGQTELANKAEQLFNDYYDIYVGQVGYQ